MGPDNPKDAKKESPNSIRALFGEDAIKNAIYGSESQTGAQKELDFTFSSKSKLRVAVVSNLEPSLLQQLYLLRNQASYYLGGTGRSHHRLHSVRRLRNQRDADVLVR